MAVVPGLDLLEDGGADVLDGAPRLPVELLDLHRSDQAFAHRVVEAVADGARVPDEALAASRRVKANEPYCEPWSL